MGDLTGKTIVLTGATSGIGEAAAIQLAAQGARIVMVARSQKRASATLKKLYPGADHAVHYADLSTLAEMKRVGAAIAAAEPKIDVLANNAGAVFSRRQVTEDGLERTFAVNHMAYFVLTHLLLENVKAAAPGARIVCTASQMHNGGRIQFDDLQTTRGYSSWGAYSNSKLANLLFTRALAKRLAGSGITANVLHPGFVATRIGDESGGATSVAMRAAKLGAMSPEEGAKTLVWLAASPEAAALNGAYCDRCREVAPSAAAQDDALAERLWAESARIAGF